MSPDERSKQKKLANKLEKWLSQFLGCYKVPNSGAISSWKGDLEAPKYLLDSKNTVKSVITISGLDLTKITSEARGAGKKSGHLIISFLTHDINGDHWAVVPKKLIEFDSSEEPLLAKSSKKIGKSFLSSVRRRASKQEIIPSVLLDFSSIALGTPKQWLIIPLDIYKEAFFNE
jgi:hypothetical protein